MLNVTVSKFTATNLMQSLTCRSLINPGFLSIFRSYSEKCRQYISPLKETGEQGFNVLTSKQSITQFDWETEYDAKMTTVVLFPGQGSYYIGMGRQIMNKPIVRNLFQRASEVVGYNVARLCVEGPEKELERHCEIAVLVTSLAALELARSTHSEALSRVRAVAGFSLGEITSLVYAGALQLDQALELLKVRAAALEEASRAREGGMLAVWLSSDSNLPELQQEACEAAMEDGVVKPVCEVANYLHPYYKVLSGDKKTLRYVEKNSRNFGVLRVAWLNVPGAYHSELMESAVKPVLDAIKKCNVRKPRVKIVSCNDARVYTEPYDIKKRVATLSKKTVRWDKTLKAIYTWEGQEQPFTLTLGPGNTLRSSLKIINPHAWDSSVHIAV